MKKMLLLAGLFLLLGHPSFSYRGPANEKLLLAFRESFPDAERVHWSESKDGFAVNFVEHGIFNWINYDKEGNFTGSLRTYSVRNLPYYIFNLMKAKYPGDKIFGVTEIAATLELNYYVKLEGPKDWKTIRVDSDGSTYVVEKYPKAQ